MPEDFTLYHDGNRYNNLSSSAVDRGIAHGICHPHDGSGYYLPAIHNFAVRLVASLVCFFRFNFVSGYLAVSDRSKIVGFLN
jgi:hypothetical protein